MTAPCGGAASRCPSFQSFDDVLSQPARQQFQQAAIADAFFDPFFQQGMRDAVEVAFEVGIHHMGVAAPEVPVHFPQRVFAASARPESVARR